MAKNSKTPKSKPIDSDRETRVLLENISRDVTRIAEAQSSTSAQIAEIKATMATKSELETVSMAVMSISGDVKNLQSDVKGLQGDVKKLDSKVEKLDSKVDAIDARLKVVENKVDENLSNHEKRITKLEETVHA